MREMHRDLVIFLDFVSLPGALCPAGRRHEHRCIAFGGGLPLRRLLAFGGDCRSDA